MSLNLATTSVQGRSSLSEHLSQVVLELIRDQGLKAGDRLPAVTDLAGRFSVATPTMREALRRLEATGVVEIRHGSGVYVRDNHERAVMVNPHYGKLDGQRVMELLEARQLIEPRLAQLAAQKASKAQVRHLEQLLKRAEGFLQGNDRSLHEANAAFHRAIAEIAGNSILSGVIHSLSELYSYEQLLMIELYNARSRDHHDHRLIFEAIKSHDPEAAHRLMHKHISGVQAVIEKKLGGGV